MEVKYKRLKDLLELYQKKQASQKQIQELQLLLQSESNDSLNLLLEEYWEESQNEDSFFSNQTSSSILKQILSDASSLNSIPERKIVSVHWWKYAVAAIFLLVCGAAVLFRLNENAGNKQFAKTKQHKLQTADILPGGDNAILKLANGSVIVLDNAKNGLISNLKNLSISKTSDGLVVFTNNSSTTKSDLSQLNTLETPSGGQYQVVLPDNTKAWLNAESSITFPSSFSGDTRKVKISGEVYFEVAKNAARPFVVESKNSFVQVLGTHFNVMDYNDDKIAKTTLLEGSVKILHGTRSEILKPGQQATYGQNISLRIEKLNNASNSISWKNGFFVFEDTSIEEIMKQVSRWYNVKVTFDGSVPVNDFSGKISRNVKLSEFLRIISYAGLKFKTDGRNLIVLND